jgi:hypothetical protein
MAGYQWLMPKSVASRMYEEKTGGGSQWRSWRRKKVAYQRRKAENNVAAKTAIMSAAIYRRLK